MILYIKNKIKEFFGHGNKVDFAVYIIGNPVEINWISIPESLDEKESFDLLTLRLSQMFAVPLYRIFITKMEDRYMRIKILNETSKDIELELHKIIQK